MNSLESLPDLRDALLDAGLPSSNTPHVLNIKLILVEDISGDVVEALGSRYKIDPNFFDAHINPKFFRRHQDLIAVGSRRRWFQLRINKRLSPGYYKRWPYSNKLVETFQEGEPGWSSDKMDTQISIWIGQDSLLPNTTIGIVLLDNIAGTADYLFETNLRDACIPTPDLATVPITSNNAERMQPCSWFDDVLDITLRYPWFEATKTPDHNDKLSIVCRALYIACAEWLEVVESASWELDTIGSKLHSAATKNGESHILKTIESLTEWHKHLQGWRKMVSETLDLSIVTAQRLTQETSPNALADIASDFYRALRRMDELDTRISRLLGRGTAEMQLTAARQSLAESHDLARLSWLATIFVPLTFVSGLFSMGDDLRSMKNTFWTYFAVAVPVTLMALVTARWGSLIVQYVKG